MPKDPSPETVREAAARLADVRPMRRGSLSERSMKCGKKLCRCHDDPAARHGPYFSVTRVEGGKTRSRYLSASQAEIARAQVEAGQQFRKDVEAYWEACERWADAEIEAPEAASQGAAKKGASEKRSRRKSRPKSRRS